MEEVGQQEAHLERVQASLDTVQADAETLRCAEIGLGQARGSLVFEFACREG